MAQNTNAHRALQGRLIALEAMIAQAVWQWSLTQPHQPSALADWLHPVEEQMQAMQADPAHHPVAAKSALATVHSIALLLEDTLQRQVGLRISPGGERHS